MLYGINMPAFGDFCEARVLGELAHEAEAVGWDGFFVWDHMIFDPSWHAMVDPWVGLAAVAMSTRHIKIGTLLTPLPRRRPWKLARETVSLDRLSGGRLILGVGIGDPAQWEYGLFGEETDARVRARQLDEGLDVLTGLWRAEPFSYSGQHYQLQEVCFRPGPMQQPRIPIWVGGWWPNKPPMRRSARWDGVNPGKPDGRLSPEEWREIQAYIAEHRVSTAPYDLVHTGTTSGEPSSADRDTVTSYAAAGCTWWIEDISPWRFGWKWEDQWSPDASALMRERIRRGPPRL